MNEIQTEIPGVDMVSGAVVRPVGYKKRHRWQWGWQKWLSFTEFVFRSWPRNH